jgi:hypothetical protein
MIDQTQTPRPSRMPRLVRTAAGAMASLGLAVTILGATAGSTLAFNTNRPDAMLGGYGVNVAARVTCDEAHHQLVIETTAMVMTPQGPNGPTAGPYDAGQWVRQSVFYRADGQANWTPALNWSAWGVLVSSVRDGDFTIDRMTDIGTNALSVTPGHSYEILVLVDYWTGVENVIDVTPSYGVPTDGSISTYNLSPGVCRM